MNIKFLSVVATLTISSFSIAQKDEIKALEKATKNANLQEIEAAAKTAETAVANSTDDFKAQFYYTKAKVYADLAAKNVATNQSLEIAAETLGKLMDFEKSVGKDKYTKQATDMVNTIKTSLFDIGAKGFENKTYKLSQKAFESIYNMSKKDTSALYNASSAALNDKNYDVALVHFNELNKLGYTGIVPQFFATNKETNKEDSFGDKITRDLLVTKGGTHTKPRDGKSESKKAEIIRYIALIYNQKGETEKAKNAFKEARQANPKDATLYTAELTSYKDAKDLNSFEALANEALGVIPSNEDLLYTLGLNYADLEQYDKSKTHLTKLLEINPKYKYANYSVGFAILGEEKAIVEQMNKLGTTAADNKKYDELKTKRDDLLKSTIPYFRAELNNVNENEKVDILKQLITIYTILVMDDEVKKTKVELEALEK
jgi:tetratricopeptide (TPR) repeat protein